ncbi:MAG: histidine--tRNA ligase, partial [Planctomycetota bacterium]
MTARVTEAFRRHGYAPIETPALEYAEILVGKGGEESDRLLYRWTDAGGREVALRFDLTVPLARFVAEHAGRLVFPFRRYHVGPVWRAERPQKGRFREFLQCDADLVGATGAAADAEMLVVMDAAYRALDVGRVTLHVNDRRVLNGLLETLGASEVATGILRALDKLDKQGAEAVAREMVEAGLDASKVRTLLDVAEPGSDDADTLASLGRAVRGSGIGEEGVVALGRVRDLALASGVSPEALCIDPSVARGLDYYTGIVYEARMADAPGFGSVGGGGRYDDLAGLYSKTPFPGVGGSVGIDRLLAALEAREGASAGAWGSEVLVVHPGKGRLGAACAFAAGLRSHSLSAEIYPEARKHGAQMRYADRMGIRFVFTPDDDGTFHGKDLVTGETFDADGPAAAPDAVEGRREGAGPAAGSGSGSASGS